LHLEEEKLLNDLQSFLDRTAPDFGKAFESATLEESFEELPLGSYKVRVEEAELTTSSAGKHMSKWKMKVVEGEYQGRYVWKNTVLDSDNKAKYLSRDIQRCGVSPGTYTQLRSTLLSLKDLKLDIEVKESFYNGRNYRNINIIGLADDELPF
jgi:hypothetical protein